MRCAALMPREGLRAARKHHPIAGMPHLCHHFSCNRRIETCGHKRPCHELTNGCLAAFSCTAALIRRCLRRMRPRLALLASPACVPAPAVQALKCRGPGSELNFAEADYHLLVPLLPSLPKVSLARFRTGLMPMPAAQQAGLTRVLLVKPGMQQPCH